MRLALFLPLIVMGFVTLVVEALHASCVSVTEELARLRGDLK